MGDVHQMAVFRSRINVLQERYNKCLRAEQGQRIFGPIPGSDEWNFCRPAHGSEVFVGHIPRNVYEDVLVPIFSTVGNIFELRLMMEFSGLNRGYCFVTYENPRIADRAVDQLHNSRINSAVIVVYKSLDNNRLYISGIPVEVTETEIGTALGRFFPGITSVAKKYSLGRRCASALVEFESHRLAMGARKVMWPSKMNLWGAQLNTEWARPERRNALRLRTTVIIRNLPPFVKFNDLIDFITRSLKHIKVMYIKKITGDDCTHVEFSTVKFAEMAVEVLNGMVWYGRVLSVSFAHPRTAVREPDMKPASLHLTA